jgi:uncharacterized protein (UPF0332 family)
MKRFEDELLVAAELLIERKAGDKGRLPRAKIRRSISTAYYAIFHFALDNATLHVVGVKASEARRRRILARVFPHKGLLTTFNKIKSANASADIAAFLQSGNGNGAMAVPRFARDVASAFVDAQSKRHDADYDLNASLSEDDAKAVIARIRLAINGWRAATTASDRDFKHALSILMLLQGKLKGQD